MSACVSVSMCEWCEQVSMYVNVHVCVSMCDCEHMYVWE